MLLDRVSTTQSFSDLDTLEDSTSPAPWVAEWSPRTTVSPKCPAPPLAAIAEGDQVVFARLDVAEALGIWRHALGRVVETHAEALAAADSLITLDVKFDGHDMLHRYLPDLFEKRTA